MTIKLGVQEKPYATLELPNGHNVEFYGVVPINDETRVLRLDFYQQMGLSLPQERVLVIKKDGRTVWGRVAEREEPEQCARRIIENWEGIEKKLVA